MGIQYMRRAEKALTAVNDMSLDQPSDIGVAAAAMTAIDLVRTDLRQ
jgi:hypothetical protein